MLNWKMLENVTPLQAGSSFQSLSSFDPCVAVGYVDLGMQMDVVGDEMEVCESLGLLVYLVFGDNAIDFEKEQVASVFWDSMARFDTSGTRMAVSAHCLCGSHLSLQMCLYKQHSPHVHPEFLGW
ncbi:hypothetical protein PBY51_009856 [Eleginops maclovinus]|uniref:Uncharacterized protein n=1 Tax=Eleginops maclovinus TaxID=56733 RepID=A0AAN7XUW6_ELEMC|nr:hypothetical protein PBY51_009856 [Eleginops maclovinus]